MSANLRSFDPRSAQNHVAVIEHLIIDGSVREEMGLKGKPAPDIFVEAAGRMGVSVFRAIVFEDGKFI